MYLHFRVLFVLLAAICICGWLAADDFPQPYDSEKDPSRPMPPAEAARAFRVPPGFHVSVMAAEPEVRNPIAMTWDGRGRLWIAENFTYAERAKRFDLSLRDRVLIFPDPWKGADGRKVFLDSLQYLTSVEVGRGGVWLMCPPQLLFVPDRNGDDKPDGPPEVVLEGFDVPAENYHNFANGLRWGPDGWLYGRCGASSPGKVRRPGDKPDDAIPLAGGIWRYHPDRKVFEPLSHGTTNPWGHDWTADGEAFFVNSVNGHLWHLIPGAHYRRSHTNSPNRLVYAPMEMHADHWHWDHSKDWTDSRKATTEHDRAGGGHAHSGCMIYGGTQWPAEFRGRLLTLNLHGRRANVERLERSGNGYVGRREPDTLFAADPWFRGIDLNAGPDGAVYVLDWSDIGECHENTGVHRNSGRVFAVRYGQSTSPAPLDLRSWPIAELVRLHRSDEEWFPRQARNELANRRAVDAKRPLLDLLRSDKPIVRLRAMWSLRTLGLTDAAMLRPLLDDPDEHVRVWAIRLLSDAWPIDTVTGNPRSETITVPPELLDVFVRLAREDKSGLVRLVLASLLQRLPVVQRPALAAALLSHPDDAADANLPMLIWYGLIPVAERTPHALVALAADSRIPLVREWTARRFAEVIAREPKLLDNLLAATFEAKDDNHSDVIRGIAAGLAGIRGNDPPPRWKGYARNLVDGQLRSAIRAIDVIFGDKQAIAELRQLALDDRAPLSNRIAALESFIGVAPADLRSVCEPLLATPKLNAIAARGLTRIDDSAIAQKLVANIKSFAPADRVALIDSLASRPTFAAALLDATGDGRIARADISAAQARQIRNFGRPELTEKLAAVWGAQRDSPKDKADQIAKLKAELTRERLASADKPRGRALFAKNCATCHRLFGVGAEIGPDLTGAGRKEIDYLLSNIVDPSAVVTKDYQITVFNLHDGRVLNGIIAAETDRTLTVQTATERIAIAKADIESRRQLPISLMPDDLLGPLSPTEIRDLFGYLMTERQVEMAGGGK